MATIDKVMEETGFVENEPEAKLIEKYNELKDKGEKKSKEVVSWVGKYFEQIIAIIFALLLIGIQQFAEPKFEPLFFLKPKFWFEYIPYVTGIWVIIFSTIGGNNKWLAEVEKAYKDNNIAIQKHVDDDRETPYIHDGSKLEDKERKTLAWKTKVSKKIDKKRNRLKISNTATLQAFLSGDDTIVKFRIKYRQNKRIERIRSDFVYLLNQLSNEYIKDNLEHLEVKYDRVSATILTNGVTPSSIRRNTMNYKEDMGSVVFSEFGVGFLATAIVSAVVLSLDLIAKEPTVATWIFFVFKAFMLWTYYFRANARRKAIFYKTIVKAQAERLNTLDECKRRILSKNVDNLIKT